MPSVTPSVFLDAAYLNSPSKRVMFPRVEVYCNIELALGHECPEGSQSSLQTEQEESIQLHAQWAPKEEGKGGHGPRVPSPVETPESTHECPVESPVSPAASSFERPEQLQVTAHSPADLPPASLPAVPLTLSSTPAQSRAPSQQQVQTTGSPPRSPPSQPSMSPRPSLGPSAVVASQTLPHCSPTQLPVEDLGPEQPQGMDTSGHFFSQKKPEVFFLCLEPLGKCVTTWQLITIALERCFGDVSS